MVNIWRNIVEIICGINFFVGRLLMGSFEENKIVWEDEKSQQYLIFPKRRDQLFRRIIPPLSTT